MTNNAFLTFWLLLALYTSLVVGIQLTQRALAFRRRAWPHCPVCGRRFKMAQAGEFMFQYLGVWLRVCGDEDCQFFARCRSWTHVPPEPCTGDAVDLADFRSSLGLEAPAVAFTAEGGIVPDMPSRV